MPVVASHSPVASSQSWLTRLFEPVDAASIAMFRISFGIILAWESLGYLLPYYSSGQIAIVADYVAPPFLFKYYGFEWVAPWSGGGMAWQALFNGAIALLFAAGVCYRLSAILLFLGVTYIFLLDQAQYLNHMYLVSLISFLMIFVPANRAASVDAMLRSRRWPETAPAWSLWILRFQIGIVYFFAGVAKLNSDWLHGEPLRQWLLERTDIPVIGLLFTEEIVVNVFAYGALLFDLLVFPAMLWRRSRPFAFGIALIFHLLNASMFDIGIFPWFAIAATTIFFDPSWPRRWIGILDRSSRFFGVSEDDDGAAEVNGIRRMTRVTVVAALAIYVAIQLFLPLRHLLYPGSVNWTYEGHRFSWRMKLHDRESRVRYIVTDTESGKIWNVDPASYLHGRQLGKMGSRPDMILQFAHFLRDEYRKKGYHDVCVTADVLMSLNGRPAQPLIDPTVNLSNVTDSLGSADWILRPELATVKPRGLLAVELDRE